MTNTLTIHNADGTISTMEMTPEMVALADKMAKWDGWCRCDNQETGEIIERGHSVDVMCRNCGGALQIG